MMQRKIYICILIIFSALPSWATPMKDKAPLVIRVVDACNGSPLSQAFIQFEGQRQLYQTNEQGTYTLYPKKYPILFSVSLLGYHKQWFQIPAPTTSFVAALNDESHQINTAQIWGQKYAGQLTNTTERLSRQRLSQTQNLSLAEQLSALPGMRVLSSGALIEKPILEGMTGSRIAIVNNQSKLVGQHWGDDHAPEMSLPSYAKVSVEKGAKSVKYGSNAMGGVIIIDTQLNPSDTLSHLHTQASYTTNGKTYGENIAWEQSLSPTFRYRLASKYYRGGSYSTADYLLFNTGSKLHDEQIDLAFRHKNMLFNGHLSYYDAAMGIFSGSHISTMDDLLRRFQQGRPDPDDVGYFSYRINAPKQHVQHFTGNIDWKWILSEENKLNFRFTFQHDYRREYDLRKGDNAHLPSFAFHLSSFNYHADWTHRRNNSDYFEIGAEMLTAQNISNTDTKAVPIIPNYSATEIGTYGLLSKRLNEHLFGEAGVRFDGKYMNSKGYDWVGKYYGGSRTFFALTGNVGLRYQISQQQNFHFNTGWAWRAPEPNELYSKGVHHGEAIFQMGDPNLSTEQALKTTLGYVFHNHQWDINANGFFHYIHNYIYDVPHYTTDEQGNRVPEVQRQLSGVFPKYFYTQSDGIFYGGDLSVSWHFIKDWRYQVRGEWMRAKNISLHTYFPEIPADRYTQSLIYAPKWQQHWSLEAEVQHQYVARQYRFSPDIDLLPQSPPAYHLLNGHVTLHFKKGIHNWDFYIQGTNLLNKLYKDYNNRMRFFAHDRGRSLTFGLRYSF